LEATAFDDPDLEGTGDLVLPGPYPRSRRPSGGLVSNVSDLLRLGRFLLAADVFPRMRTPHGSPIGGVYGLGLFGERVGGVEVWGHGGSWGGFQSILLLVPERDAVFAGLTNASLGGKALRLVEDAFLEQAIGSRRVEPPYRKLDLSAFASFAGTYENSDGRYVVEPAGDGLLVHVAGEELIGLPLDEQTFRVPLGKHVGERFDFPRDGILRFGGRLAARAA
jgi:CubicO group peptidase (beta-lactamase class C family)